MDCAQTKDLAARAVSGNASPADEAALRAHAAACPACAAVAERARKVWALMGRLPAAATKAQPPRIPVFRLPRWAIGAAAAVVAVASAWLLRPSNPTSPPATPVVDRPPTPSEPAPTPEQVRTETELEERVREVETQVARPPEAPPVEKPLPAPELKPAPLVQAPPPAPAEPKPLVQAPAVPAVAPAPPPAPPARETLPTAARLEHVRGDVVALVGGARMPAAADFRLTGDDGLLTLGKSSQAVLAYEDGTRLVLGADTSLTQVLDRKGELRRIHVEQGVVAAQVARQAGGESLVFVTPTAEARVVGTRLTLLVSAASTRLEVKEGRVKLSRRGEDGAVDVGADQYAVAAKGTSLAARGIPGPKVALREDFERGRWNPLWQLQAEPGQGLRTSVQGGALLFSLARTTAPDVTPSTLPNDSAPLKKSLDQVQRISALASKKDWPRAAALETKGNFAFGSEAPLRVRVNAWHSHADADRMTWVGLNRGTAGQGLSLERRGEVLQLSVDGAAAPLWKKDLASVREWETLEIWLSKDQIALRRNGLTVAVAANPLKTKAVQISVGVCAKAELAQEEETRLDDLDVSWLTKAEFEQISR